MDPEDDFNLIERKRKRTPPTTTIGDNPMINKKKKPMETKPPIIPTRNRYEELSDSESFVTDDAMDSDDASTVVEFENQPPQQSNTPRNVHKQEKPNKLPPIVLHGEVDRPEKLIQFIEKYAKKEYQIKYSKNRITIFLENEDIWNTVVGNLKKYSKDFHTYTKASDRAHSFVLCGLSPTTDIEELEKELKANPAIQLQKLFKMNNTWTTKFLVITSNKVTIKTLESIKLIYNTRIHWQRYKNSRTFIQCHKCQKWGHATSNCFVKPACMLCSEEHEMKDCPNKDKPPRCANCGKQHPANNVDCPIYKKLLVNYHNNQTNSGKQQQRTVKPPVPNINDHREFRPLKPSRAPRPAWQTQPNNENNEQSPTADYDSLMEEMRRLNGLIDMKKFTENLKKLNDKLVTCKTESEKFTTLQEFYTELDRNGS